MRSTRLRRSLFDKKFLLHTSHRHGGNLSTDHLSGISKAGSDVGPQCASPCTGTLHFQLIQAEFLAAVDALPPPKSKKDSWLLFLSENEFHETGLLFASFLIRKAGHKVIYLGANVPLSSLEDAVEQVDPDNLLFFMVNRDDPSNDTIMFQTLAKRFHSKKIFVACDELRLNNIKTPKILFPLHSVEDLEKVLT